MAPWINPIQLASLLFLWGYYFIQKYEQTSRIKDLVFSGLLIGLSWAFWDAVIYFAFFLGVFFLYNKKFWHSAVFIAALFIGTSPKLIADQILFGFAFYSIFKHFFAILSFSFSGGIYNQGSHSIISIISALILLPFSAYIIFKKKVFFSDKKTSLFLIFSILIILFNASQIRYLLIIMPVLLIFLAKNISQKMFKIQVIVFIILSLIVINPYIIQIKYSTNAVDFNSLIKNLPNLKISSTWSDDVIIQDLNNIAKDFPNQTFIVGNNPDDYQTLANLYWSKDIKEFVSIQDYQLYEENSTVLSEKTICSKSKPWNRRDICFSVDLRKSIADNTNYSDIHYAISMQENLSISSTLIKKYQTLSVFEIN